MHSFILEIFIMLSLGTVIFLVARALPRISDFEASAGETEKCEKRWWSALPLEKIDKIFNAFLEKTLRRVKLILMKLDNMVSRHLGKFKKNDNANNSGNDLMNKQL